MAHVAEHNIRGNNVPYIDRGQRFVHPGKVEKRLDTISDYLEGIDYKDSNGLKQFVLPCQFTLGESWGAIQKAWKAFKIAHAKNNRRVMAKYAKIITQLRFQMGIQGGTFDKDLIDQRTEMELFLQNAMDELSWKERKQNLERVPDYDEPFSDLSSPESSPNPPPREEIFHTFVLSSATSCPSDDAKKVRVESFQKDFDRSQDYSPSTQPTSSSHSARVSKHKKYFEERCYLGPASDRNDMRSPQFHTPTEDYRHNPSSQAVVKTKVIKETKHVKESCPYQQPKDTDTKQKTCFYKASKPTN